MKTTQKKYTIVLAWTDNDGTRQTGRMVQRDLNWFPETEACRRVRSVTWLKKGTLEDVAKARAYAAKCGHDNAGVFVYETREKDPHARAEAELLAQIRAETPVQAARWLLEHENDERANEAELRRRVRVLLGRVPVAEDWDRLPEYVRHVLEITNAS